MPGSKSRSAAVSCYGVMCYPWLGNTGRPRAHFDSGHFRPAPRTCRLVCGRLSVRQTGRGAVGGADTAQGEKVPMSDMRLREFITLLGGAVSSFLCLNAPAQEGYYGVGHDKWHQGFYSKLKRNDGQGSCCNLMDCRPTQSRMVGDHYEVKVDGAWTPVPRAGPGNLHRTISGVSA
jgi:hypothetical protein